MIKSIELTNIQSHEETLIEFVKGLNVIKGTSHAGKSAVVKAFSSNLRNIPPLSSLKTTLFKTKKKESSSKIIFEEGNSVERKLDKKNKYIINDSPNPLEAFKRSEVPSEVLAVTNMSEVNIQGQFDRFFLLQDSPGDRAKKLNEAANLTIIDEKTKLANSIVLQAKKNLGRCEEDIKSKKDKIKSFDYLKYAEKLINEIDYHISKSRESLNLYEKLHNLTGQYAEIKNEIKEDKEFLEIEPEVLQIKSLIEKSKQAEEKRTRIKNIIFSINCLEDDIAQHKDFLNAENDLKEIKNIISKQAEASHKHTQLKSVCNSIRLYERHVKIDSERIYTLDLKLDEVKKQYKESLKECPTCGALKEHWRKEIE